MHTTLKTLFCSIRRKKITAGTNIGEKSFEKKSDFIQSSKFAP